MRSFPRGGTTFELDTEFLGTTERLLRSVYLDLNADDPHADLVGDAIKLDPLAGKVKRLSTEWKHTRKQMLKSIAVLHLCVGAIRSHFEELDAQLARKAGEVHWE